MPVTAVAVSPKKAETPPDTATLVFQENDDNSSLFGQLVYLSSTWDESVSRYHEPLLSHTFNARELNWTLRRKHRRVFAEWLSLPLAEQALALEQYLNETGSDRVQTLRSWMQSHWYRRLIPSEARQAERLLFISDVEILIPVLEAHAAEQTDIRELRSPIPSPHA